MYVYIYIYTHIHMYTYTQTYTLWWSSDMLRLTASSKDMQ